jgi:hypothetical protein
VLTVCISAYLGSAAGCCNTLMNQLFAVDPVYI